MRQTIVQDQFVVKTEKIGDYYTTTLRHFLQPIKGKPMEAMRHKTRSSAAADHETLVDVVHFILNKQSRFSTSWLK